MITVEALVLGLWRARPPGPLFRIGLTGGVASGKTTLAGEMSEAFARLNEAPSVAQLNTDGFLKPNAVLSAEGILDRKGVPETYDRAALAAALQGLRDGPVLAPGYSHTHYDIDPALTRRIEPVDVLIVEGLGLDGETPLECLIYLDAAEDDQERWYGERFLRLWEQGLTDDGSFYARFRAMPRKDVPAFASKVWRGINLPNLETHIAPVADQCDLVLLKDRGHALVGWRPGPRGRLPRFRPADALDKSA